MACLPAYADRQALQADASKSRWLFCLFRAVFGGLACGAPIELPQPDEGGYDHGYGKQLSGGDGKIGDADAVVRHAEVFCEEACRAVQEEVNGADGTRRAGFSGKEPQQHEHEHAVNQCLVDGRGMARQHVNIGPDHGPGQGGVGDSAVQFGVDEVAEPSGCIAERNGRGDEIQGGNEAFFVFSCVEPHGDKDAEKAAVVGHAAFPYGEDVQGMGEKVGGMVEEDFAQPAADDDAEHAVKEHFIQVFFYPAGLCDMRLFEAQPFQQDEQGKGQQVHEAVPVNGDWPEPDGDGVWHGMDEHGAFCRCVAAFLLVDERCRDDGAAGARARHFYIKPGFSPFFCLRRGILLREPRYRTLFVSKYLFF